MGTPGPTPEVTLGDTLSVFTAPDGTAAPLTATEVADELGCARRTAHRKLTRLVERGDLETKKVGARSRVWWRPSGADGPDAVAAQFGEFVRSVEDYAIFTLDPEGHVRSWNAGARSIKGYEAAEILGEHFSAFYTDEAVERETPTQNLEDAAETGRIEVEGWRVRKDGSTFWADVVITAVRDEDGDLEGFIKVTRDLTDRRRAENERRLRHAVSSSIARAESLENGLDAVIEDVCELTAWEYGEAWVPTGGKLEHLTGTTTDSSELAPVAEAAATGPFDPGEGLVGRVWQSGESEWLADASTAGDTTFHRSELASEAGLGATFAAPVISGDDVVAVLLFAGAEPLDTDDRLVEITESVCAELGGLVLRKQAEGGLRREREFLDRLLEALPIGLATFSDDGRITHANDRAAEILGVPGDELLDYSSRERTVYDENGEPIPPEERPFVRVFETGEPVEGWEGQIERPDGERRWVAVNVSPIENEEGVVEQVVVTGNDITDRKRREVQLRRERTLTDRVLHTSPVGVMVLDSDGEVVRVNEKGKEILSIADDEIESYSPADRTVFDEGGQPVPLEEHPFARTLETAEPVYDQILQVEGPGGDRRWLSVSAESVRGDDGEIEYVVTTGQDITELKTRQRELERERNQTQEVLKTAPIAIAVQDADGKTLMANQRAQVALGLTEREILGEFYDDGWTIYDGNGEPIGPGGTPSARVIETGEPVMDVEVAIENPDGDRRWFTVNAAPVFDADEELDRVVTAGEDVTQVKQQARRLEQERDELKAELAEIFERIDDAFYALDDEFRFTYVNDRAEVLLDRAEEELLGEPLWDEWPETETVEAIQETFRGAAETNEPQSIETYSEELGFWVEAHVYPSETGLSVYFRDVTDRKEREEELKRYETVVETVREGVYTVDAEGRFTMVNDAYAEMTGYPRDELLGAHVSKVVDEETIETAQSVEADLVSGDQEAATFEANVLTADGETVRAEGTFSLLPGESETYERAGVVRDVTERVEHERELREYQRIVETVDDGVYVLGPEDRFTRVNEAFVSMTRFDESELLGMDAESVFGDTFETRDVEASRRFEAGDIDVFAFEEEIHAAADETITVESRFRRFGVEGGQGRVGVVRDITERKERERQLKRHETLIEESTDVNVILDADGTVEYVTPSVEYVLGRAPEDLEGENAFDYVHVEDRGATLEAFNAIIESDQGRETVEFRIRHADGSWVWLESRGRDLRDDDTIGGLVVYTRDVTDRKRYEGELESRARQQAAISRLGHEALQNPALDHLFAEATELLAETLETDYSKVLDLDPEAEELLLQEGVGWDDVVGGSETVPADDDSQAGYTLLAGEPVVVNDFAEERRFSGPKLLVDHDVTSGISTVIGSRADPWGVLGTHDTDRRSFGDEDVDFVQSVANVLASAIERQQYEDELEQLVEELEESNERLEQFAYVASHDLQEPLRMISSYLSLIEDRYADQLDQEATEFIDFAVDGAERMRAMINGLLSYSRVDTEAEPLEPTDCADIVERVRSDLQMQVGESDADVEVRALPTVTADENQLEQVFQNLISNAIKYGGDAPNIEIGAERNAREWVFHVADDGIGIDPDHTDRIFDVFERLHTNDEYSGTGVGLALCQKIVERHGGDIWVESELGEGATFYFTISTTRDENGGALRPTKSPPEDIDD